MSAASDRPVPARRPGAPRLVAMLALFVLSATVFCAIVGFVLVRQADERQAFERRHALLGAIEDIRNAGADFSALDPAHLRGIERTSGLKDLRFEAEPVSEGREVQSVLDRQGRIVGWFSWEPDRSMSNALGQLRPLLAATGLLLIAFAAIALHQVRRAVRELAGSEQLAWSLAYEDTLTGLPNHRKTIAQVDAALANPLKPVVTLAAIDTDGLKDINDAFGRRAGDDLLIALATRIRDLMPEGAQCGRMDGDGFALVLAAKDTAASEEAIAALVGALGRPFWVGGQSIQIGVTAGLAHAPRDGRSRDELMRRADLALRAGKRERRGGVTAFVPAMDAEFDERHFLEQELRRAIESDALQVHYQPVVSADGNRLLGAEALLRWSHPQRGAIGPADFIPVAEQCGLMGRLGDFVLRRALADAARWPDLDIAVNLSPVQVRDAALVRTVSRLLGEYYIAPARLVLEITEGVLIDKAAEARERLAALRALGVQLALDDFGTGYSSLAYLQNFRFDKLKIDKGFVDPLARDADSQALVQAVVALGRALKVTVLAEGVETEEQRVLLRLAGCDEMQGFLFAQPAPAEVLDRLYAEHAHGHQRPPAAA